MTDDYKKHQQQLAQSGYRVPDAFYLEDPNATQASTEESSGDGGKAASAIDPASSEHGYQGKPLTPEEMEQAQSATGQKLGATPAENKGAPTPQPSAAAKSTGRKK